MAGGKRIARGPGKTPESTREPSRPFYGELGTDAYGDYEDDVIQSPPPSRPSSSRQQKQDDYDPVQAIIDEHRAQERREADARSAAQKSRAAQPAGRGPQFQEQPAEDPSLVRRAARMQESYDEYEDDYIYDDDGGYAPPAEGDYDDGYEDYGEGYEEYGEYEDGYDYDYGDYEETPVKKKKGVFWKIYFVCLLLSAVVIGGICWYLHGMLGEYEDAQPKYVAEEVFNQYFNPVDYDKLLADATYNAGLASLDTVRSYLETEVGGAEFSWSMGSSSAKDESRYIVKAGNKQIGSIVLKESGERTRHGVPIYEFSSLELALDPSLIPGGTATIRVPAGYTVYVDGQVLDRSSITGTYTEEHALPFAPEGQQALDYEIYTLGAITQLPGEVAVTSPEGLYTNVTQDGAQYTSSVAFSQELQDAYSDYVLSAIEGYAAYMQKVAGSGFNQIRDYFDPNSELYSHVANAANDLWMVKNNSGNDFTDVYAGEFYKWSDEEFSCHISFTQILHRDAAEDFPDPINMYVYLHNVNGQYKIYQWFNV